MGKVGLEYYASDTVLFIYGGGATFPKSEVVSSCLNKIHNCKSNQHWLLFEYKCIKIRCYDVSIDVQFIYIEFVVLKNLACTIFLKMNFQYAFPCTQFRIF